MDEAVTPRPFPNLSVAEALNLSTHQKVVLDYLKGGRAITNAVAMPALGIGSLSSRIAELRRKGYDIVDKIEVDRFERRFKKYRLKEFADASYT